MIPVTDAHRVLFVRTDRLGETLLNLPTIVALKRALPRASLTVLVHPELQPLMSRFSIVDEVLVYPQDSGTAWWGRASRLGRLLTPYQFDLAAVSNPMKELHLAVWLARIPWRVGYDRKWGWLLTHRLPDRKALGERHEVEYNLDLVRKLGLSTSAPQWPLPHVDHEWVDVLQLFEQQGVHTSQPMIVVHPWTSNPLKQWPIARFIALLHQVVEQRAFSVVLIGGPEARDQARAMLAAGLSVVNLVGRVTLTQLAALLGRARLLISNDSGPVHLAAVVKTKTVVLFGTSDPATGPRRWGPWGEGHTVIWKPSMEAITVDEVFGAVQRQLA